MFNIPNVTYKYIIFWNYFIALTKFKFISRRINLFPYKKKVIREQLDKKYYVYIICISEGGLFISLLMVYVEVTIKLLQLGSEPGCTYKSFLFVSWALRVSVFQNSMKLSLSIFTVNIIHIFMQIIYNQFE